jgi:hypothetical protein
MASSEDLTIHGDGRITFSPFYEGGKPYITDFGKSLQWARKTQGGVLLRFSAPFPRLEKRTPGGAQIFSIFTASAADDIEVSVDERGFSLNGTVFNLEGTLRTANQMADGSFVVAVIKNEKTGDRNLFRYGADGTLKWQVGERTFQRGKQFTNAHLRADGKLMAEGGPENLGAIVDYETGKVLAHEDIR